MLNVKEVETRECSKCKKVLPLTKEYWYTRYGEFITPCKECRKEYQKPYQKENKQRQKQRFHTWHYKNKDRMNDKCRNWCRENKEHVAQTLKEWQQQNPEKIKRYRENRKHKKHDITKQEWELCKEYFNNSCAYCGISNKEAKKKYKNYLHKEHIIDEGKNDLSNCVPACKQCNSEKSIHSLNNWYNKDNSKYTYERYFKIYKWMRCEYKRYILPKM